MHDDFYTVAQAASHLQLHAKTVLRFIHEGRLPAVRMGKAYRLRVRDVLAFAGDDAPRVEPVRVTCVVEVPSVSRAQADRITTLLLAMLASREGSADPVQCQTAHDGERGQLKVILIGGPSAVAALLGTLHTLTQEA
ncbi:MAG: hypothetical protein GAK37_01491 [Pseudomonas sp.]|nr:MAG: hypothetical protein GAK37_01491 [Pseudomonas sp.]